MRILKAKTMSRPVWARGLKLKAKTIMRALLLVAPRVGAWIETKQSIKRSWIMCVAPRVGAWIETVF